MQFLGFGLILIASLAQAQSALSSSTAASLSSSTQSASISNPARVAPAKTVAINPNTPVITIHGLCDNVPASAKPEAGSSRHRTTRICKTIITRSEFDALANALQTNMDPATKRQLAADYPKLLLLQHEFRAHGLDKDPKVKKALAFANLRSEAEQMAQRLQNEAAIVPQGDIEQYYKSNGYFYDRADLLRIYVPKEKRTANAGDTSMSDQNEMKKMADALLARASAGEDFAKLQNEAYEAAGIVGARPPVIIGNLTANELPPSQRSVMALKEGEVSQLIVDQNGYYILKVLSKDVKPIAQVQTEIGSILAQQRFTKVMQQVEQSARTELNDDYFPATVGSSTVPTSFGLGGKGFGSFNSRSRGFRSRSSRGMTFMPAVQQTRPPQVPTSH